MNFQRELHHTPILRQTMQDFMQSKKSVVRVCAAKRSNESPSGAFKRQNGLAQQDGGALPRQVTFYAKESRLCKPCAEKPLIRANVQTVCRKRAAAFLHKERTPNLTI